MISPSPSLTHYLGTKDQVGEEIPQHHRDYHPKVVKENNNPEINETFRFALPPQEKTMHTLFFQVYMTNLPPFPYPSPIKGLRLGPIFKERRTWRGGR